MEAEAVEVEVAFEAGVGVGVGVEAGVAVAVAEAQAQAQAAAATSRAAAAAVPERERRRLPGRERGGGDIPGTGPSYPPPVVVGGGLPWWTVGRIQRHATLRSVCGGVRGGKRRTQLGKGGRSFWEARAYNTLVGYITR